MTIDPWFERSLDEFYGLVQERLRILTHRHQIVFACCCCQRIVPNYRECAEDEGWGEAEVLERFLDRLWNWTMGHAFSRQDREQMQATVDALPLDEDTCDSWWLGLAQDAATAVMCVNECIDSQSLQMLLKVSELAVASVSEWLGLTSDYNLAPLAGGVDDLQLARKYGLPPPCGVFPSEEVAEKCGDVRWSGMLRAECDKQLFDIKLLEMHPELRDDLIQALRSSSSVQGVQSRLRGFLVRTPRRRVPGPNRT